MPISCHVSSYPNMWLVNQHYQTPVIKHDVLENYPLSSMFFAWRPPCMGDFPATFDYPIPIPPNQQSYDHDISKYHSVGCPSITFPSSCYPHVWLVIVTKQFFPNTSFPINMITRNIVGYSYKYITRLCNVITHTVTMILTYIVDYIIYTQSCIYICIYIYIHILSWSQLCFIILLNTSMYIPWCIYIYIICLINPWTCYTIPTKPLLP